MIDDIVFAQAFLILLAWAAVVLLAFIKLKGSHKRRLVRCPESGAVTIVEAEKVQSRADAGAEGPLLSITHCQFWPEKKNCGMGCLRRYEQNQGFFGFDPAAVRPFDTHK